MHNSDAYDFLASVIGTTFGDPNDAPHIAGDLTITVDKGGTVLLTTADLNEAGPDSSGAALHYAVTATNHGHIVVDGVDATSFTQAQLETGHVSFSHDGSETTAASFSVSLADGSGLTAAATVNATVILPDMTIDGSNGDDMLTGATGNDTLYGQMATTCSTVASGPTS